VTNERKACLTNASCCDAFKAFYLGASKWCAATVEETKAFCIPLLLSEGAMPQARRQRGESIFLISDTGLQLTTRIIVQLKIWRRLAQRYRSAALAARRAGFTRACDWFVADAISPGFRR
jgi:hypothetical protein